MFTLINIGGRHHKVYKIRRTGSSVFIRYGRISAKLRDVVKTFGSVADARNFLNDTWNTRVDHGYYQVTAKEWYGIRNAALKGYVV